MDYFLSVLNSYANLITAVATAVLAILTGILWFENRSLRKAGYSPEVVAYMLPHPDGNGAIQFVVANIGKGPAFNISFQLEYDDNDFKAHNVLLLNDPERMPIAVLPQDEKIKAIMGLGFELFGNVGKSNISPLMPFTVLMSYNDVYGRKKTYKRKLDIRQFAGLPGIAAKSNERMIIDSIDNIENHIATIAKQSKRFSAFVDVTKIGDNFAQKLKGDTN